MLFVVAGVFATLVVILRLRAGRLGVFTGLLLGTIYMILVPLGLLLAAGELSLPLEFSATNIVSPIAVEDYRREINILLWLVLAMLSVQLLLGANTRSGYSDDDAKPEIGEYWSLLFFVLAAYVTVSVYLALGSGVFEGGHWAESKEQFVAGLGVMGPVLGAVIFASRVLVAVVLTILYIRKAIHITLYIGALAAFFAFELYVTGNRIIVLQTLVLFASVLIAEKQYTKFAVLAAFAIPLGIGMNLFRYIRPFMHESFSIQAILSAYEKARAINEDSGMLDFLYGVTEAVNMHVLLDILAVFPEKLELLFGETLFKIVFIFIPRAIWSDKPDSIATIIGDYYIPGSGVSLVATFYGECYANFGMLSVVVIPLLALVLIWGGKLVSSDALLRSMVGVVYGFTIIRMPVSDVIVYAVFTMLLVKLAPSWRSPWRSASHALPAVKEKN